MKKLYDLSKKYPILAGIVGFFIIYFSFLNTPAAQDQNSYKEAVLRFILTIACTAFIALISGDKILVNSSNKTAYGILMGIPLIMVNAVFGLLDLFLHLKDSDPLVQGWLPKILLSAVFYLSLGFFEETLFRALINDAILYQFRNKRGVFVAIALISSFTFGIFHVWGSDIHNLTTFAQAFLKTISCALAGFLFLTVYWKTRNIVACAIIHGICDYSTVLTMDLFTGDKEVEGYVMEGATDIGEFTVDNGVAQCFTYVIQIILLIIALLIMLRFIKTIDFKKIREEW